MAGKIAADAASMVGEAALNGVFQGLFQALTPVIQEKLGRFWGVDENLKRLKTSLLDVQPLLNDAETRQFTEENVRSWVGDLRGLTYDMEDILDEMNYELLRSQLENRDKSDGEQVQTLFSSLQLVSGAVENFPFNDQIASKINKVLEKWEKIVERGNTLNLREGVGGRTLGDIRKRRETTIFEDKNRVFGRESDKEEIISLLKTDESSGRGNLSVIGIVGMGGLGKTTLARLAYKDTDQFDMKVWVHVSHDFDRVRVTRSIIEDITKKESKLGSLNPMQYRLQELVKEKKLLLVLDDAWTENLEDWEILLAPLIESVQKGSKIIVTTRSEAVCKSMGSRDCICIYKLEALSGDDCWTILKEKVFGYSDNTLEQAILEKLRVKIVKMCQGLPLVANVVGGLLRVEPIDKWERLLKSEIWLSKTKDDILPALMLSYLCLDPHIKRCFIYTATCFKFGGFAKDEMIRFWMAEGFIEDNKSDEMDDIANDYFDNLVARQFFQPLSHNYYVMHDLILELAKVIMGNVSISIRMEIWTKNLTEEIRHVSIIRAKSLMLDKLVKARSLLAFSMFSLSSKKVWKQITHDLKCLRVLVGYGCSIQEILESIGNMKHLRYLSLDENNIESLPDSICTLYNLQTLSLNDCRDLLKLPSGIGSLINLRYLFLRGTRLKMFPDSLCKLEKLQQIDLSSCKEFLVLPTNICELKDLRCLNLRATSVEKLPDSICRLYNLQSLYLFNCNKLTELPKEMSNLISLKSFDMGEKLIKTSLLPSIERFTNICKLSNYCITNEIGIGRLNLLMNLQEIWITNLEKVKNMEEARAANLKNKQQLVKLVMEWRELNICNFRDRNVEIEILEAPPRDGNVETEILEALEPSYVSLRHLTVKNYGGFMFPGWLGDPSFFKLEEIKLIGCNKCKLLTSLGQLRSLKYLVIEDMQELKHVGREFFGNGAFPSLQNLQLCDLPKLEGWCEAKEGDFPRLIILEVKNCPKLRELPITPFTLKTLRIEKDQKCENLSGQDSEIGHCNEITMLMSLSNLTSLSSLTICGFRRVELLPKGFLQSLKNIEDFIIMSCDKLLNLSEAPLTTLSRLYVIDCPNMMSFGKEFQNSTCLKYLSIIGCPRLESSLEELTIVWCVQYFKVADCSNTILTSLLPHLSTLEHLSIEKIKGLQYLLPDLLLNLTNLKSLKIVDCIVFTSLLAMLPSSLVHLDIICCTELASLPDQLPSSLESLSIRKCTALASLPDELPSLLKYLRIEDCTALASLPDELPSPLKYLRIEDCTALASLPDELPSSLADFYIDDCDKIKSLPKCPCNLTSLSILNCPLVESFPENGLPTGLATLTIFGCPILTKQCRDRESKEWNMIKCIENVGLMLSYGEADL